MVYIPVIVTINENFKNNRFEVNHIEVIFIEKISKQAHEFSKVLSCSPIFLRIIPSSLYCHVSIIPIVMLVSNMSFVPCIFLVRKEGWYGFCNNRAPLNPMLNS